MAKGNFDLDEVQKALQKGLDGFEEVRGSTKKLNSIIADAGDENDGDNITKVVSELEEGMTIATKEMEDKMGGLIETTVKALTALGNTQ